MSCGGRTPYRPLTAGEFEQIRRLAYEKFGLDLRKGKEELVSARLGKKIREAGFGTFEEYCSHVVEDRTGEALVAMIDALTTNYTNFFREPAHFDFCCGRWCCRGRPGRADPDLERRLLDRRGAVHHSDEHP